MFFVLANGAASASIRGVIVRVGFASVTRDGAARVFVGARVTRATRNDGASSFASVRGVTVRVKFVGGTRDGAARVFVGARVASAISDCRTTDLAAVVKIIIIVKLVGDAGDRRARVLVRAHIASTTSNCWTTNLTTVGSITIVVKLVGRTDAEPVRRRQHIVADACTTGGYRRTPVDASTATRLTIFLTMWGNSESCLCHTVTTTDSVTVTPLVT